jgi:hypothetical protein
MRGIPESFTEQELELVRDKRDVATLTKAEAAECRNSRCTRYQRTLLFRVFDRMEGN